MRARPGLHGATARAHLPATVGSGTLGLWDEAAALVFLYGVAEGLEELAYSRTRHPDPARGQYVLLGGNPTPGMDPEEVASGPDGGFYPVGVNPEPNWRRPVYNFSRNRSPDGAIEVKSRVFGGALKGRLLVVEYSAGDDILAIPIPPNGGLIDRAGVIQVASGLSDPVDLAEDVSTGNLYVAQLVEGGRDGGAIVLLRPDGGTP